ncbi:tetratricopeptide repeat protein [Fretibacter rubidus]|uniref:tetratricopeptide repeat protein n=1 Tax=Fretibacter rubidus TaxID=570162 RepID=UPI00352AB964
MSDYHVSKLAKLACLSLSALAVAACATPSQNYATTLTPEGKLFGDYLAGTYARYLSDAPAQSKYFGQAFAQKPTDLRLGRRAVVAAISAGDFDKAETIASQMTATGEKEALAETVLGAKALRAQDYTKALSYFEQPTADLTMSIMMKIMAGWAHHGLDDNNAAREVFKSLPGGSYFDRFGLLQLARLETTLGNYAAAREALALIEAQRADAVDLEFRLTRAEIDALDGKAQDALKSLQDYSDDNGTFETGPVPALIAALEAGEAPFAALSPKDHVARALTEVAYGFFAANRSYDNTELFLYMALSQDPNYDKGQLWLADILAAFDRDADALAYYDGIPTRSPYFVQAQMAKGYSFLRDDRDDEALATFKRLNDVAPSVITRDALGRIYLSKENYDAALPIYEALVASLSDHELAQDPSSLYLRGVCYERLDMWEKAVADFQRVLSYKPDDADTLNYLGYTWVDRGENLTEAFTMIRRAVALEPSSGAIVDSLGWAHYKLGQYAEAKEQLELAVTLSPSSATIIDHLGDVYYKLGRKTEARYQWERALEFDPTDKEIETINQKLQGGLGAVQAAP